MPMDHPARHLWPGLGYVAGSLCLGGGYLLLWIPHEVAGLAILGIDFLTYIKLLPADRLPAWSRMPLLWSLPLVTASVTLGQVIWWPSWRLFRTGWREWLFRIPVSVLALYLALQILPLDWAPGNLFWPTNRIQTICATGCAGLVCLGPVTSTLIMNQARLWLPWLSLSALGTLAAGQQIYLPFFEALYRQELSPGPGPFVLMAGALLLATTSLAPPGRHRHSS